MKFKKSIIFLLILALVLPACRTKENEEKQTYDGVELTYYKVFEDEDTIKPYIQEYIVDHPGLQIHYRKFDDFDEYQKTILNEMAEGEGPDIFSMQNTWFMSNIKKITPMVETLPPEEAEDMPSLPDRFAQVFVETAYKDLVLVDTKGRQQVYGIPLTVDTLGLYYNKAHFEDRVPTRGRPSSTWEGIKEDTALLTKTDNSFSRFEVSGMAMGRADNISRGIDVLYMLFLQYGANFYNNNISKATFAGQQNGEIAYPGMEALKFYTSFADPNQKHYSWNEFVAEDDSDLKEVEAFAAGKISMMFGYAYTYEQIKDAIKALEAKGEVTISEDDIGVSTVPQLYDPQTSKDKRVAYASYFAETVSRNTKYPEIAWDFLTFMASKENMQKYFENTHRPTSRRDLIKDQSKDPIYGVFATQVGYAESFPILDYYRYKDIFTSIVNKSLVGAFTNQDLVDAQDLITNMLPSKGLKNEKKEQVEEEETNPNEEKTGNLKVDKDESND